MNDKEKVEILRNALLYLLSEVESSSRVICSPYDIVSTEVRKSIIKQAQQAMDKTK